MLERVKDMQFAFLNYVAEYYESRQEPGGVIVRCEHAMNAFPARAMEAKMDLRLAKAYLAKDRISGALQLYRKHLASGGSAGEDTEQDVARWVEELESILATKSKESSSGEAVEEPTALELDEK